MRFAPLCAHDALAAKKLANAQNAKIVKFKPQSGGGLLDLLTASLQDLSDPLGAKAALEKGQTQSLLYLYR